MNQRIVKPRKRYTGSNLVDMGRDAVHAEHERLQSRFGYAGQEATRKDYGVLVAMLPGAELGT